MSSKIHARVCGRTDCGAAFIGKATQKFCSRSCAGQHGNAVRAAEVAARKTAVKPCANTACGREFGPGRLGLKAWGERRFCSHECAGVAARAGVVEPKRCALDGCGALFERGAAEAAGRWASRKFCSAAHAAQARGGPRVVESVPVAPMVQRPFWRPNAPGWSLRPGDAGYDDEVAS